MMNIKHSITDSRKLTTPFLTTLIDCLNKINKKEKEFLLQKLFMKFLYVRPLATDLHKNLIHCKPF